MKHLHFEPVGGASGDMMLGALVGLGVDPAELAAALRPLGLDGLTLVASEVERNGMPATRVEVRRHGRTAEEEPAPDPHHDHHAPHHGHDHHHHAHDHDHHDHEHHHEHRGYADIVRMIEGSHLGAEVRAMALAVFRCLGEAEAAVHKVALERVQFHEVGAWDSIADIVGTAWAIDRLRPDRITTAPLVLGRGEVRMAHGTWPVPAPATVRIIEGMPVRVIDLEGETVTPTGAALLKVLARPAASLPAMELEKVSAGAGKSEWPDRPNVLRAWLGRVTASGASVRDAALLPEGAPAGALGEAVGVLSASIDDMTPQAVGLLAALLMEGGALDVTVRPNLMKKGRPGVEVTVLTREGEEGALAAIFFRHSTTLGLRVVREGRWVLPRCIETVETTLGPVRVKIASGAGGASRIRPEYEDCQKICRSRNLPLHYVLEIVRRETASLFNLE